MTPDDTMVDPDAAPEIDADPSGGAVRTPVTDPQATRSEPVKGHGLFSRLYHGETRADIVGRWKLWFALSAIVVLIGAAALATKGLNLGIDFKGGTVWRVPAGNAKVADVQTAMGGLGYDDVQVQQVTQSSGTGKGRFISVEAEATTKPASRTTAALTDTERDLSRLAADVPAPARNRIEAASTQLGGIDGPFRQAEPKTLTDLRADVAKARTAVGKAKGTKAKTAAASAAARGFDRRISDLSNEEQGERSRVGQAVSTELAKLTGSQVSQVTVDTVGPSWGRQISEKARNALIVFLVAITLYITLRFEFRMAVATLAALVHDLVIVVGIYALFGFPVTPATVIAILTILGFSIYDGIVVFDRVDENTAMVGKRSRMTYTQMANLSLNQVMMRSLNTSITALLPILSILVIGAGLLGASTLKEFGLALFLGLLSGAYSSIFIATPLLAILKEREPRYRAVRERLSEAGSKAAASVSKRPSAAGPPAFAGAGAGAGAGSSSGPAPSSASSRPARPAPGRPTPTHAGPPGAPPRPRKQGKKR